MGLYEFRIEGRLSESLWCAFEDFSSQVEPAQTVLHVEVRDQVELHAALDRIQSIGLELLELRSLEQTTVHELSPVQQGGHRHG